MVDVEVHTRPQRRTATGRRATCRRWGRSGSRRTRSRAAAPAKDPLRRARPEVRIADDGTVPGSRGSCRRVGRGGRFPSTADAFGSGGGTETGTVTVPAKPGARRRRGPLGFRSSASGCGIGLTSWAVPTRQANAGRSSCRVNGTARVCSSPFAREPDTARSPRQPDRRSASGLPTRERGRLGSARRSK